MSSASCCLFPGFCVMPGFVWVLVLVLLAGRASGWQDCTISPDDKWRRPTKRTPAMRMRYEFPRRYTCANEAASYEAASYFFDSPCTGDGFFSPDRILSCLQGRRVVFLGDSLSVQQADSLVGMLGWHPYWIESTNPYNGGKGDEDGKPFKWIIKECWTQDTEEELEGMAICWDLYESYFPPAPAPPTASEEDQGGMPSAAGAAERLGDDATQAARTGQAGTSVHMRDFHEPTGHDWLSRAIKDFNETRSSDVFVVNFGAHYEETPEGDETFKEVVFPMLDEMAEVGKTATVVWREISPVHFPSRNASYENFDVLEKKQKRGACCTGTPPRVFARNTWVEDYLVENGLTDTVKLLRIYEMSLPRASAHHTCHMAPPSTMDNRTEEARRASEVCNMHPTTPDCRHWSAPGVVEEWNALLLHHLCPAG